MLRIHEVATLTGITKRTLQYYDEIGLLCPIKTDIGYRLYDSNNLDDLQQIPLKDISSIMSSPSFDRKKSLINHKRMLEKKRISISKMIDTLDKTLKSMEGGIEMSSKEKFEGFDFSSNDPNEKEARAKWGDDAVDESQNKLKGNEKEMSEEMNRIYRKLANIRHLDPASAQAQEAISEWFIFLNRIGTYSLDAFEGLGEMYVEDERFKNNIDKFGVGLASFMRTAMKVYAKNNK